MIKQYNCHFLREMLAAGGQLIDVRSPVEFNQGALNGAVNMPIENFKFMKDYIDKLKPILLYCRTGLRSEKIKIHLQQQGYQQVHNIGGYRKFIGC